MRILVAPQEFKASLTAAEAAAAIAAGIRDAKPGFAIELLPLSDGGPGFIEALHTSLGGSLVEVATHDAIGRPRAGLILQTGATIFIEAAQANALAYLEPGDLAPLTATSYGVGELLRPAFAARPQRVVVGVGGSATTDGGAGMAQALGARLLDASNHDLAPGGAALARLEHLEWERPDLREIVVASDVTNPLLGPNGAAAVFGPQKGATPAEVEMLEEGLGRLALVVERDLGINVRSLSGGGAAGGLAAGLVAFLGARIESGFEIVANACDFLQKLKNADLVITGEGSFDEQSLHGKTTGRVLAAARSAGKPWLVLAGRVATEAKNAHGLDEVLLPGEDPLRQAAVLLRRLAASVMTGV